MKKTHDSWQPWHGWSTISAGNDFSFTLWLTGLHGTGKTTLAQMVQKVLMARGYKAEIIDAHTLSHWLKHELHIDDVFLEESNQASRYDAFVTYICSLLARNGIITITTAVSPLQETRLHARQHIKNFIEAYLHCPTELRQQRLQQLGRVVDVQESIYQPPTAAELNLNTGLATPEQSTLHILSYLEYTGHIAPLWEEMEQEDEQSATIKARLQALGYLD